MSPELYMQDTAELFFEDYRVPASHLLREEGKGFKYMMEKLQQERLKNSSMMTIMKPSS